MNHHCELKSEDDIKSVIKEKCSEYKLLIVDFYADWCGPCKMIDVELKKINHPDVCILKVNVDDCEEATYAYKVQSMPTFCFFRDSELLGTISGANLPSIMRVINSHTSDGINIRCQEYNKQATICNIRKKVEFNGKTAICKGINEKNRFVMMLSDKKLITIKKENLEFA
jgi:thioredoxin 1